MRTAGWVLLAAVGLTGCGSDDAAAPDAPPAGEPRAVATAEVAGPERRILAFGDSLFAGYGVGEQESYPAQLEAVLRSRGHNVQVTNAGVSGDTSAAGRQRIGFVLDSLEEKPDLVIVELGGNDGLRGHPLNVMKQQLAQIIETSRNAGAQVLLVGMQIPPNYGSRYTQRFHATYQELAVEYELPLVAFLLQGVALTPALMQKDGIHPTEAAQEKMLDNVWPVLQPLLESE